MELLPRMPIFDIELSTWILADGNYGSTSFDVGKKIRFALEFYLRNYSISSEAKSILPMPSKPSFYKGTAQSIYNDQTTLVLDFGQILAYRMTHSDVGLGQLITGDLSLHVDPFHYYDDLCRLPGIPSLIYDWELLGIDIVANPTVDTRLPSLNQTQNDNFIPIKTIDIRGDKQYGSIDSYILHCELLSLQAHKTL
jgi:hypothetical protein